MKKIVLFLLLTQTLLAQPTYPPPSGVYCSCGPTTGVGNGSVDPQIAAKPFVKGILVRIGWDKLEPSDNTYKWSLIDGQIAAANTYHKKISLAIGCGIQTPQWVFGAGAQRLVSSVPYNDTLPVPWDDVFLAKWTDLIAALGARYQTDTTIQLVYMTASTANGYEMQLPFATSPTLAAVGYSDAHMIQSWRQVMDAFNAAFPNHYLTNDFHPVNTSNAVPDSVYAYAHATLGPRYGANAWWWTQHNTTVYPTPYAILQQSAANDAFSGVQMAYSGTTNATSFGPGGMPAALELAVSSGVCYWEIWNQDILNTAFDSLLTHASCTPLTNVSALPEDRFEVFPNPAHSWFKVVFPEKSTWKIDVVSATGHLESSTEIAGKEGIMDVQGVAPGVYWLRITDGSGRIGGKVVVVE